MATAITPQPRLPFPMLTATRPQLMPPRATVIAGFLVTMITSVHATVGAVVIGLNRPIAVLIGMLHATTVAATIVVTGAVDRSATLQHRRGAWLRL